MRPGCANAIHQHFVGRWRHHSQGRGNAFFAETLPTSGAQLSVEQVWVSRPDMSVRRVHWTRAAGEQCALIGEEIVRPGLKRFAWRPRVERDRFMQTIQQMPTEEDHQEPAWHGHGEGAMALLRPSWMLHGRRVIEEWHDRIDGVPVVRRLTERVVPLDSPDMLGHACNPLVMDMADRVVFSYDPARDVIREWHDVWEGEPCTVYHVRDLVFDVGPGIGDPYVITRIEEAFP